MSTAWFEAIAKFKEFETEATKRQMTSLKELKQGIKECKNTEECKASVKKKLKEYNGYLYYQKSKRLGRKEIKLWFMGKHVSCEWKTFKEVVGARGHVDPMELKLKSMEVAACALS